MNAKRDATRYGWGNAWRGRYAGRGEVTITSDRTLGSGLAHAMSLFSSQVATHIDSNRFIKLLHT
jgi:hypothetical protein